MWFDMYIPMRDRDLLPHISWEENVKNKGLNHIFKDN